MKRRDLIRTAGWMAAGGAAGGNLLMGSQAPSGALSTGKKPNIIFILADDLGIGDVGCYGADNFQTPNIDRLARGGVRFTNAYTAPLCGPSRALILTGRYAFRTGATNQDATGRMKPTESMLPAVLKQAGYVSAAIGKWGQLPLGPGEFGFDEYLKFTGSGVYWNTQVKGKAYTVNGGRKDLRDKEYLPDVMHDHLIDFITRRRAQPFYVYYSMSHVHGEILPTPDSAADSKDHYGDNIRYMDKLVGRLVADLDRLKMRDNTLIVFTGDNGTSGGRAAGSTVRGRRLSGEKGSMLEGGALVPMIANWPGKTPAGKVSADLVDSTDFLPTFAELAGAKRHVNMVIDGRSFAPQLHGQKGQPRDWIFIQLARQWYVRDAKWKLNQAEALFNMTHAPFEEPLVPAGTRDPDAIAARTRLQAVLNTLNPAGGILDDGDGTGRHANRESNRKKKKGR